MAKNIQRGGGGNKWRDKLQSNGIWNLFFTSSFESKRWRNMQDRLPVKKEMPLDSFLDKYLTQYNQWMAKGQISYSSKVIPVSESLDAKQWVMPKEQVLCVLEAAESIALQDCECRTHYHKRSFFFRTVARNAKKLKQNGIEANEILIAELTNPASISGCCQGMDVVISTIGITGQKLILLSIVLCMPIRLMQVG